MAHLNVQRMYNDIIVRGRRNAPTYAEVKRDMAEVTSRVESVIGLRY